MAYKDYLNTNEAIADLLSRKEFAQLKVPTRDITGPHNPSFLDQVLAKENKLVLHPAQQFIRNLVNPNTPTKIVLVKHDTGTGKTNTALACAFEFIRVYKRQFLSSGSTEINTPMIFVIGFSKAVFQRELLRRPEFGFVNSAEIKEYNRLMRLADSGSESAKNAFSDFESRLRKRLTKKSQGGFFKFFGYKEFFNRLLTVEGEFDQNQVDDAIAKGIIKVNHELVKAFANSLVICDEIHNVYNSAETNNYGLALRVLFNLYETKEYADSSLRALLLTATPINNSPTEIVDLLNLLVPGSRVRKEDLFTGDRELKPTAVEEIVQLVRGRVSFLRNQDPKYFPQRIIIGKTITIPIKYLSERISTYRETKLPYLKFIRCPMSKLHWTTYQQIYNTKSGNTIPPDGMSILDMILPSPAGSIGLFRTNDVKYILQQAPQAWKDKFKIDYVKGEILGDFMKLPTLKTYSVKYAKMVKRLVRNLRENKGKVLIVHQYVKMSGVLFIQEVLRRNGFIDENAASVDTTLCTCGITKGKHPHLDKKSEHTFIPARFITVYGEIDPTVKNHSIDKFNSPDNIDGNLYRILLGSKSVNESIDLNAVQNVFIMSVPPDIPTLLQILGRAIRNKSHIMLPMDKRKCEVSIFTSQALDGDLSYEEYRYFTKLMDYLVVQQLEKTLNQTALDATIHRDVIFPPGSSKKPVLGTLYFDPLHSPSSGKDRAHKKSQKLKMATFWAYHSSEEIDTLRFVIRRLFMEQSSVWTYDELWKAVRDPPFDVQVNPAEFVEDDFLIALYLMPIIQQGSQLCKITTCGKYYILLPTTYSETNTDELGVNTSHIPRREIDAWYRRDSIPRPFSIDITAKLRTSNLSYNQMKYRFYNQFANASIESMPTTVELYDMDFHLHLVEDSIRYIFNIYTRPNMGFSELHTFYFKMLYFYDSLDMILFANQVDVSLYKDYVSHEKIKFGIHSKSGNKIEKPKFLREDHGYNSFLMSSIAKTESHDVEQFNIDRLNKFLGKQHSPSKYRHPRLEGMELNIPKQKQKITKVFGHLLPVGHFLTSNAESSAIASVAIPKLYQPDTNDWKSSDVFIEREQVPSTENDLLIGYYEKNPSGIDVKFKLRLPAHKIEQHKDSRLIERGSSCHTRKKEDLVGIAKMLGLTHDSESIKDYCQAIKLELMRREMRERQKSKPEKRLRWFYLHFERQN